MKKCIVIYAPSAQKELYSLDKAVARRIATKIEFYSQQSDPLGEAKMLSGKLHGLYRYRIGDYRVIFEVDQDGVITILVMLRVMHRKDIYR